jgi:hypothetical protein
MPMEFSPVYAVYKIKFLIYTFYIYIITNRDSGEKLEMYAERAGVFLHTKCICCTYYMATELVFTNSVPCVYLFLCLFSIFFLFL